MLKTQIELNYRKLSLINPRLVQLRKEFKGRLYLKGTYISEGAYNKLENSHLATIAIAVLIKICVAFTGS